MVADANLKVLSIGPDQYPTDITSFRDLIEALRPGSGPVEDSDFVVEPADAAAGLAVDIGKGRAFMEGPNAGQGSYFIHSSATLTLPWAAPGALPRVDTLVAVVHDSQYGGITGPLGPDWVIVQGVEDPAPVAVSDAAIAALMLSGDVWLAAYDVAVGVGAESFTAGDITRRFAPLTSARRGSELVVTTATSPGFSTWTAQNSGTWKDFLPQYWAPVQVLVPSTGQIRVTITGRGGNGTGIGEETIGNTLRFRYRLEGANEVAGEALTNWSFVSRGWVASMESSSTSKTLRGLNPGWTTVIPQFFVTGGSPESHIAVMGGDLDVVPIF